jgi:hypothetical protein
MLVLSGMPAHVIILYISERTVNKRRVDDLPKLLTASCNT